MPAKTGKAPAWDYRPNRRGEIHESAEMGSESFSKRPQKMALTHLSEPGLPNNVEVSLASNKGFWLLLNDKEFFVPYAEFPWFKQATLEQITTVEWPTPNHLYWPLLDVDLAVESIRDPSRFPLVAKPVGKHHAGH